MFGSVVRGWNVVEQIHQLATDPEAGAGFLVGQILATEVTFDASAAR